jgi:hypothetical protein
MNTASNLAQWKAFCIKNGHKRAPISNDCAAFEKQARALGATGETDMGSRAAATVAGAAGAGLVPSKTKRKTINFSRPEVAERRVKRLKKSVWASGHLHGIADSGFRPPVVWFVTLTYKGVNDWQPQHIRKAVQGFRDWCKARGYACRYTWVAELQGRGAVHYHLLAWLPQGVRMPQWDKSTKTVTQKRHVAAWWPHGMTNTQKAQSGVGYLMKYLSKLGELTIFPKGLRLYGIGGLNATGRAVRSWLNLPEWVKLSHGVGEVLRRAGSLVLTSGEILEPAYKVRKVPGGIELFSLRELPERFHAGAYSTFPRAC